MMHKVIWTIVLTVVIATMLPAGIWITNTALQKGYCGDQLRRLAQFLIPKRDLYERILDEPINVSESGKTFRYQFANRYAGRHVFGLLAKKEFDLAPVETYTKSLRLSISCGLGGTILYERKRNETLSPWWIPSHGGQGFTVFSYMVPDDLPIGRPVDCDVKIERGDPEFGMRYGIVAFYAGKESEE